MKRVTTTALTVLVVVLVLIGVIVIVYMRAPQSTEVKLVIGDTLAYRGSHRNHVEVVMENPEVMVRGVQLELCDGDNYLSCTGCDVADRIRGFTCVGNEKPNGCYGLVLFSFAKVIEKGKGPIVTLSCDVAEQAQGGECRQLTFVQLKIADENKQPLDAAVKKGRVCFKDCITPTDCDASLWCYGARSCVDGACQSKERCLDDGLYCNGKEYCDEESKQCNRSPEPCAHCYNAGCRCNEDRDTCDGPGGEKDGSI